MLEKRKDSRRESSVSEEEAGSVNHQEHTNPWYLPYQLTRPILCTLLTSYAASFIITPTLILIVATIFPLLKSHRATQRLNEKVHDKVSTKIILFLLLVLLCAVLLITIKHGRKNILKLRKSPSFTQNSKTLTRFLLNGFFQALDSTDSLKSKSPILDILCSDKISQKGINSEHNEFDKVSAGKYFTSLEHLCSYGQEYFVYPVFQNSIDRYVSELRSESPVSIDEQMKYELVRLSTFSNFPQDSHAFPIRLAQAGFHYNGETDRVSCFSCSASHGNWRKGENPLDVHRRISPDCQFLNGTDTRNVAIRQGPISYQNGAASNILLDDNHRLNGESEPASSTLSNNHNRLNGEREPLSNTLSNNHNHRLNGEREPLSNTLSNNHNHRLKGESGPAANTLSNNHNHILNGESEPLSNTLSNNHNRLNTANRPNNNDTVINRTNSPLLASAANISRRDHDLNSLGVCYEQPKYPRYAVNAIRVSSFSGWPPYMSQTPDSLASAGLFYAGFGDCVRCFFCGGGLRNWEEGDIPWVEHARWYPKCPYVKQCKGEKFIQDIMNAAKEQSLPAAYQPEGAIGIDPKRSTPTDPFSTPAVLSVLDMGYSRDIVREAVTELNRKGTALRAEEIMEYIFSIEARDQAIKEKTNKAKERPVEKNSKLREQPEGVKGDENEDMQNSIIQENRQLKEQSICKVCMEGDISIVFLPCGHLATCVQCAPALTKCPICRTRVKGTVRAFLA